MRDPRRPPSEKVEQQHIVNVLTAIRAKVYVLGTRRPRFCPFCKLALPKKWMSTRQTPGIPDMLVFLPKRSKQREILFIEAKSQRRKLSDEQREFREYCLETTAHHVKGGLDEVLAWLLHFAYLELDQISAETLRRMKPHRIAHARSSSAL
jgi:hypothetical protein